jgi:hypothetical protein
LEEFTDRVIFKHPQGWRIYISYVLANLMEDSPQNSFRFLEKGLTSFPGEQTFAEILIYFAQESDYDTELVELLKRVRSVVQYDVDPYINSILNPEGE